MNGLPRSTPAKPVWAADTPGEVPIHDQDQQPHKLRLTLKITLTTNTQERTNEEVDPNLAFIAQKQRRAEERRRKEEQENLADSLQLSAHEIKMNQLRERNLKNKEAINKKYEKDEVFFRKTRELEEEKRKSYEKRLSDKFEEIDNFSKEQEADLKQNEKMRREELSEREILRKRESQQAKKEYNSIRQRNNELETFFEHSSYLNELKLREQEEKIKILTDEVKNVFEAESGMSENREKEFNEAKEAYKNIVSESTSRQQEIKMEYFFKSSITSIRSLANVIRKAFSRFEESLVSMKCELALENNDSTGKSKFMIEKRAFCYVLAQQKRTLQIALRNLEKMYSERGWDFVTELVRSVEGAECERDALEKYIKYRLDNDEEIKSGSALQEINDLFFELMQAYSAIPSLNSLKADYEKSYGNRENNRDRDPFVEEPDDEEPTNTYLP